MEIRLQKRIADSGYCSRRKAEALMEAGKVKVNGKVVTKLGTKVSASDSVEVSGKKIQDKAVLTIALHKPEGYICSKGDPHHSQTIMDLLPPDLKHLKPAGRLDKDSEGLLILSSDGELIQKLTHPRHGHTKFYEVLVKGRPKETDLFSLKKGGIKLDGYPINPITYKIVKSTKDGKTWVELLLTEGRKRQIRRVMDYLGFPVLYLRRMKIGALPLGELHKGAYKILSEEEIQKALS